ncbi:MATE family efflux transporter [Roseateles koreensis]|uniref:MATE family efflux transporter n=1 Tax=Roseateles koreensis TaxID=2987526 RepID=A0ABT5KU43_9BURK|nr:MATE family efflux transporter [Roseateles koreensis]
MTQSPSKSAQANKPAAHAVPGLLALAWPIFAEQLLHLSTGVADTLMVSRLSDQAVAGLGSAWQIVFMLMMAFNVLAIGASIVITHHLGLGDAEGARRLARAAVSTNLCIGMAFSLLLIPVAPTLLRWVQLSPEQTRYALPFLQWMGGTLFLEAMNYALSASLRAHGHTRAVMWVMLGQNLLNVGGNAVLIFGLFGLPALGVTGVALSTAFSRLMACGALWWLSRSLYGLRWRHTDLLRVPLPDLRRLLHYGVPAVLENVSWFGAFMLITALSARMGESQLATQTYVMQLANVVMLGGVAMGLANEILVGRLVGAGRLEQAYAVCLRHMRTGLVWTMVIAALAALLGPRLLALLTADAEIQRVGATLVMLGLLLEPGRSFNLIMINALRACGDARYPAGVGMLSQWGVMAFGAWLLGTHFGLGLVGVWCAFIVDEWLRGLLMLQRWRSRRWMSLAHRARAQSQASPSAQSLPVISRTFA